jgi:hypothetical protein
MNDTCERQFMLPCMYLMQANRLTNFFNIIAEKHIKYLTSHTHVSHYISVAIHRTWETHQVSANLQLPGNTLTFWHRSFRFKF